MILDLLASGRLGEIDQGAVEPQDDGNQDVLCAPPCGHRRCGEVVGALRPVALNVSAHRGEVGPEVGQYLTQARLLELSAVERAEAAANVVEAMIELVELPWGIAEWVGVVADPPQSVSLYPAVRLVTVG
jgi:hypothetical protein